MGKRNSLNNVINSNIPLFIPPLIIAFLLILFWSSGVSIAEKILPNISSSLCSASNWHGYTVCTDSTWDWALWGIILLSSPIAIVLTRMLMNKLKIKWVSPIWGVILFITTPLFLYVSDYILSLTKKDGISNLYNNIFASYFLIFLILIVAVSVVNSRMYSKKNK